MLTNEQTQQLKDMLTGLAQQETWEDGNDDFCVIDFAGSNVDHAYRGGKRDGEIEFARQLLVQLFNQ